MRSAPLLVLSSLFLVLTFGCEGKDQGAKGGDTPKAGDAKPSDTKAPASHPAAGAAKAADAVPAGASVHWLMPKEGSKVPESFPVAFGVGKMTVTPAGEAVMDKSRGHHHVVVDGKPIPEGTMVPKDATNIHYGKGQTSAALKLAPGKHTLTLQFADGAHKSYGDKLSSTINIEVVKADKPGKVMFLAPKDGAKIKGPVKMKFGAEGYTVRPAGEDPIEQISGHHHVLVDGKPLAAGTMVPKDEKNIHYGKGQTEAELKLAAGKHTLTLQLADGAHLAYGETLSHTITVEVE